MSLSWRASADTPSARDDVASTTVGTDVDPPASRTLSTLIRELALAAAHLDDLLVPDLDVATPILASPPSDRLCKRSAVDALHDSIRSWADADGVCRPEGRALNSVEVYYLAQGDAPTSGAPRTCGARAAGYTGRGREIGTSRSGSCSHADAHADALARAVEELRVRPRRVCAADNDDDEDMPPTLEAVPASPDDSSPPSAHGFPLHEHSPPLTHDALARHDVVAMGLKMTARLVSHRASDSTPPLMHLPSSQRRAPLESCMSTSRRSRSVAVHVSRALRNCRAAR